MWHLYLFGNFTNDIHWYEQRSVQIHNVSITNKKYLTVFSSGYFGKNKNSVLKKFSFYLQYSCCRWSFPASIFRADEQAEKLPTVILIRDLLHPLCTLYLDLLFFLLMFDYHSPEMFLVYFVFTCLVSLVLLVWNFRWSLSWRNIWSNF